MGIGKNLRAQLLAGVQKQITGIDPASQSHADRQAQRTKIAEFIRSIFQAGYDPLVMVEMFVGGAAFFGDQLGVSREQIAQCVRDVSVSPDRSLIFTPTND